MQGCYLVVDRGQFLAIALKERLSPSFHHREVAEQRHTRNGNALLVALEEKPDGKQAYSCHHGEQNTHEEVDTLGKDVEHHGEQPEPEVAVDMGHHKEND